MNIGIDGNCWYCSNGMCLGDPRAEFTFERTLRETVDAFRAKFGCTDSLPGGLTPYLDMAPEQYAEAVKTTTAWEGGQ